MSSSFVLELLPLPSLLLIKEPKENDDDQKKVAHKTDSEDDENSENGGSAVPCAADILVVAISRSVIYLTSLRNEL